MRGATLPPPPPPCSAAAADTEAGVAQAPPPPGLVLYSPQLEVFFNVTGGAADVAFVGLGFRDQRRALMEPW